MSELSAFTAQPANSLYCFADEQNFIRYLGKKAKIIRTKKAMQRQLLHTAAVDDGVSYQDALQQVKSAFVDIYGITPQQALVKLANGETVAGKNWKAGVYGIGDVSTTSFSTLSNGGTVSVNPVNGQIKVDGNPVASLVTDYTYTGIGKSKTTVVNAYSYTDASGNCYIAQYDKASGKYYACSVTTKDGVKLNANGAAMGAGDMSSIWVALIESFEKIIQWIVNLFGNGQQLITTKAAAPVQSDISSYEDDGTQNAGISFLFVLAMGAALFFAGGTKGLADKAKKSKNK